jgi:putative phosphoesterase
VTHSSLLAILSDSHSNRRALAAVVDGLQRRQVTLAIHCGDICTPDSVELLADAEVHWVFGNCDLDQQGLAETMARFGHHCHGLAGAVEASGLRVAFTHGHRPEVFHELVADGANQLVCHGHTHERRDDVLGAARVICPGALSHAEPLTFAIVDLASGELEWVEV